MNVVREVTSIAKNDCFAVFSRVKNGFDFPLHNHDYIEINLILNGAGAQRVVGSHIGEINETELVCIGPNLVHGWFNDHKTEKEIKEVTIQFHKDLLNEKLLRKNQLSNVRNMLQNSKRGILFSTATVDAVAPRIIDLKKKSGFDATLELLSIVNCLSLASDSQLLSDTSFIEEECSYTSQRLENVFKYINNNYNKRITLADVAKVAFMADASFSRFIKDLTGSSFVDNLNEIRLDHVSRMLIETTHSIAEISYQCGFNNIANFNRTFKNKKGLTPKQFRENHTLKG